MPQTSEQLIEERKNILFVLRVVSLVLFLFSTALYINCGYVVVRSRDAQTQEAVGVKQKELLNLYITEVVSDGRVELDAYELSRIGGVVEENLSYTYPLKETRVKVDRGFPAFTTMYFLVFLYLLSYNTLTKWWDKLTEDSVDEKE